LQLHHRLAAPATQALQGAAEEVPESLGEEGTTKEFGRIPVLVAPLAAMHLAEVGGELGLQVAA
jgi:hypothetical protein